MGGGEENPPRKPPPLPPFPNSVRLAQESDVVRIALLSTLAFYHTPVFKIERPHYRDFPEDTFRDYVNKFAGPILDPHAIVLVAEDKFEDDEEQKAMDLVPSADKHCVQTWYREYRKMLGETGAAEGNVAVIGCALWSLEEGSERLGDSGAPMQNLIKPQHQGRDKDPVRGPAMWKKIGLEVDRLLNYPHQTLERLTVHPAYWRRGHGTVLTKWGQHLAVTDHISTGVTGNDVSVQLYQKVGYKLLGSVVISEKKEEPVTTQGILVWNHLPQ